MPDVTNAFDPRVLVSLNVAAQPGVFALLVGSGASTGAGIPTGWGVVEALVRSLAASSGNQIESGDWESWWHENAQGRSLGYSDLLAELAPTAPARRAILAGFFEPTDEDRANHRKVPGAAHRAIAKLVAAGYIRVILTTNFDRLLEQALESEGIFPQVIHSEDAVEGMEPLQHSRATVIKLHGDYASLDQRNTVEELSEYSPKIRRLLDRVLDEYGLIVSGWSGDWDHALVSAIESSANRRYPMCWTSRSALGDVAKRLTARSAFVVNETTADEFFPDLYTRVEAIARLSDSPPSFAVKMERLKRALLDPVRALEVRDLFDSEIKLLRQSLAGRPALPMWDGRQVQTPGEYHQAIEQEVEDLRTRIDSLLRLYAFGITWDREGVHDDLWMWVLQQAVNARREPTGVFDQKWLDLSHYPAMLLYRAAAIAAVVSHRESLFVRLSRDVRWRSVFVQSGASLPAHHVLHLWEVLDQDVMTKLPRWSGARLLYPASRMVRLHLSPIAEELIGEGGEVQETLDSMEFRADLASALLKENGVYTKGPATGEYLGTWPWADGEMAATVEFLERGDSAAWNLDGSNEQTFTERIHKFDEAIRSRRREL